MDPIIRPPNGKFNRVWTNKYIRSANKASAIPSAAPGLLHDLGGQCFTVPTGSYDLLLGEGRRGRDGAEMGCLEIGIWRFEESEVAEMAVWNHFRYI